MGLFLKNFIDDILVNGQVLRALSSVGTEQLQQLQAEAAVDTSRIWTELSPLAGWDDTYAIGVKASFYDNDEGVYNPTKIIPVTGGYLVLQHDGEVLKFSSNWNYQGKLQYGKVVGLIGDSPEGYGRVYGGNINATEDRLALCCHELHYVRVFNHITGEVVWTFGDGIPGDPADGRVYNPQDAVWLPNGNLIVTCVNGNGPVVNTSNAGVVIELDAQDGHLVATHLYYTTDNLGRMNRGGILHPYGVTVVGDLLFICSSGAKEVGSFDVSSGFEFVRIYKRPPGVLVDTASPTCVAEGASGSILINTNVAHIVVSMDIATGDLIEYCGVPGWDAQTPPADNYNEIGTLYGILYDAVNDVILAADYGNRRITALHRSNLWDIQYPLVAGPPGYRLVRSPKDYDANTGMRSIPINQLKKMHESCDEDGSIFLGWEKTSEV